MRTLLTALLCLSLALPVFAAEKEAAAPAAQQSAEQFLASLNFQKGDIALPGGIATLALPPGFRYLAPADAGKLLSQGWGNPPGIETLGMILPAEINPLGAAGWGVVVTYDKDGHVKDDDADKIDYANLLKDMKQALADNNPERQKQGYAPMTLVGWAEKPGYDKASHKLYWAKELHSDGDRENGLNYNIRVLGREGVLVLNAVASMAQLANVKTEMQQVTAFADFTPGNRYSDFNDKTDKVAEYGLAALVAGGVASKLGLFGKLVALLLAFKKVLLLALVGGAGWIFKLFSGRKAEKQAEKPKVDLSK